MPRPSSPAARPRLAKSPPARATARRLSRAHRIIVLASRFNEPVTRRLVDGALAALRAAGVSRTQVRTVWVPGAFELPGAAARLAAARPRPAAIVAVGAIVKGETFQYRALATAVTQGLAEASVHAGLPVTCGVVVAETIAQARARAGLPAPGSRRSRRGRQAGGDIVNRGAEAAEAAVDVLGALAHAGAA